MLDRLYVLDDEGEPRLADDMVAWSLFMADDRQVVLQEHPLRGVHVSTVFLGIDHNWRSLDDDTPDPVLWETMIFGGPFHGIQRRYRSRLDALRGHLAHVGLVETYRSVPRKTKQALRKIGTREWLSPNERTRAHRALVRCGWR